MESSPLEQLFGSERHLVPRDLMLRIFPTVRTLRILYVREKTQMNWEKKCWWVIVCQIHRRIPQSRVASLFSCFWWKLEASDSDSGSVFQLFIVGSKQFFRSFDPFLLYLTFSILKIEILLDNLIRQGKEFESKRRRKQELELINTRPGREEAKHLLNARNPLKKNGNTG